MRMTKTSGTAGGAPAPFLLADIDPTLVVPVFQPVISVTDKHIYGYESLGRLQTPERLESLGPFFSEEFGNASTVLGEQRSIDRILRRMALEKFKAEAPTGTKLFININPVYIVDHIKRNSGEAPQSVRMTTELGIDPSRVVIELTESTLDNNLESLIGIVRQYRNAGFIIAVDDVGARSSNLDRIGMFMPDIIKVDGALLQRAVHDTAFLQVIRSVSHLAETIGSALLFEGIEDDETLDLALHNGARYLQGFLFAKGMPQFLPRTLFVQDLGKRLYQFAKQRSVEIKRRNDWERSVLSTLRTLHLEVEHRPTGLYLDVASLCKGSLPIRKLWICDHAGNQISPNYRITDKGCLEDDSTIGLNWSTRPYFFNHLHRARLSFGWSMSDIYQDIEDVRFVRTFSHRFGPKATLFVDVPVDRDA